MVITTILVFAALGILLFSAILFVTAWVVGDARARDANPTLWGILTFFFPPIVLLIYMIARPAGDLIPCPHCHHSKLATLRQCPHCRDGEAAAMPEAKRPIQWALPRLAVGILVALAGLALAGLGWLGVFLSRNIGTTRIVALLVSGLLTLLAILGGVLILVLVRNRPRLDHTGLLVLASLLASTGFFIMGKAWGLIAIVAPAIFLVLPSILLLMLVAAQIRRGMLELFLGLIIGLATFAFTVLLVVDTYSPAAVFVVSASLFALPLPILGILRLIGKASTKPTPPAA